MKTLIFCLAIIIVGQNLFKYYTFEEIGFSGMAIFAAIAMAIPAIWSYAFGSKS